MPKDENHLRRNQACHQCRKRKLKCDAKRPCTGCKKAHAAVIAQAAVNDQPFDPHPTCTYDEGHSNNVNSARNRVATSNASQNRPRQSASASTATPISDPPDLPSTSTSSLTPRQTSPNPPPRPRTRSASPSHATSSPSISAPTPDARQMDGPPYPEMPRPLANPPNSSQFSGQSHSLQSPRNQPYNPDSFPSVSASSRASHPQRLGFDGPNVSHASHSLIPQRNHPSHFGSFPPSSNGGYSSHPSPVDSLPPRSTSSQSLSPSAQDDRAAPNGLTFSSQAYHSSHNRYPTPDYHADSWRRGSVDDSNYRRQHLPNHYIPPDWPPDLPAPSLLLDFINVFFERIPSAHRILHRAKFTRAIQARTSPSYSPANSPQAYSFNDPAKTHAESFSRTNDFPKAPGPSVLHAICALAATFVGSSTIQHLFSPDILAMTDLDNHEQREKLMGPFAASHASLSMKNVNSDASDSKRLLECVQATIIVGWYNYLHTKWIDTWNLAGLAVRQVLPIGINDAHDDAYYGHLIDSWRDRALHPGSTPRGPDDIELRRSVFWLAFMIDVQQAVATAWPSTLAEEDISQSLPGRLDDFELCRHVAGMRQTIDSPDLFTRHEPALTDGWTLHVKAYILIGRITRFNTRFLRNIAKQARARQGAASTGPDGNPLPATSGELQYVDPRGDAEFIKLDTQVKSFRASLASEWAEYIVPDRAGGGKLRVDAHLYAAHIVAAAAAILLHDPHAEVVKPDCPSAFAIFDAASYVAGTVRKLQEVDYNLNLLTHTVSMYWVKATAVYIRYYGELLERGQPKDAHPYKIEAEFLLSMMGRLNQLPCARQSLRDTTDWLGAASALASSSLPSPDKMWSYLRYSERRKVMLHPAYIGDSNED